MNIKNKLKTITLKELKPYKNNAKIHPEHQIETLKNSLTEYDYVEPIIVGTNNTIIGGHGRYEALKQKDPNQKIDVIDASYLKPKQQKKLRILLNKSVSNEWDKDMLQAEIESLYKDFDDIEKIADELSLTEKEINDIMPMIETEGDDDIPDKAPAITKLGDLWEIGRHRLLCGDSTKEEDVNRLMDGKKADMLHTDPPYGIDYDGGSKKREKINNDAIDILPFYIGVFSNAHIATKDGASAYIWHASTETHNTINAFISAGWQYKSYIVWNKDNSTFGRADFHWKHEPCVYGWKQNNSHIWYGDRKQTTVRDIKRPSRSDEHPTMKPMDLCERPISFSSKAGDIVLDLFLGSGSTLIACEKTNRICYGMELDEHYCDIIVQRYIDFCTKNNINIDIKHNGQKYNAEITQVK